MVISSERAFLFLFFFSFLWIMVVCLNFIESMGLRVIVLYKNYGFLIESQLDTKGFWV